MDSQQTPRATEDPVAGRGSTMVKQNTPLSPGFQPRPQGPPPLSPRYPLNNGSTGGPRLGGQQPQILHRLDSRTSLGSPTGPGGQFVQSRPPFGPPRPQNPPGNQQIPGSRPPNSSNLQSFQGPPRFHVVPGSPGIRPAPNNFVGPRPPVYGPNQPQQIYYQPRNGEIRPQRPINLDPSGVGPSALAQFRFPPHSQNPEIRQQSPAQGIPDTVVTPPPRNDWPLRDPRVNNQSGGSIVRESTNERRPQVAIRQTRDKMEVIDNSRSSTPGRQTSDINGGHGLMENDNGAMKRRPSHRENEDDDDDVVMDNEKGTCSKSPDPSAKSNELQTESVRSDSPASQASTNSYKKSATPSPVPPSDNRPASSTVMGTPEKMQVRPVSSAVMGTPEKAQDRPVSGAVIGTPEKVQDRPVSGAVTGTSEKVQDRPVSGAVMGTSEKVQDRPVSGALMGTPEKVQDRPISGAEMDTPEKVQDRPVSGAEIGTPEKVQDRPVSGAQMGTPEKVQDRPVSGAQMGTPEKVQDRPASVAQMGTPEKVQDRPASVAKMGSEEEPENHPVSGAKVETKEEPPGSKLSASPSPVPSAEKSGEVSRSGSRLGDAKSADHSVNEDTKDFEETERNVRADTEDDEMTEMKRNDSRASSVQSSRSPIPPRTPDNLATLSVPGSSSPHSPASPASPKSPKSPKSSQESVKGFDNGQLRSLSPKSPTPSVSPASPNSPNSPAILKSAEGDRKKATFADATEMDEEVERRKDGGTNSGKTRPATPGGEVRGKPPTPTKISERAQTPGTPDGRKSSSMKRSTSGRSIKSDAGSESGANQTNQGAPTTNGVAVSPTKKIPSKSREGEKKTTAGSPVKSPSKSVKSLPRTPETGPPSTADKKVPMNKVQVGAAPSPNLKTVRSKIGSLDNASYKPGGGKVKIENRKLDFSKAQPKIAAKNDKYTPSGGDKKITQVKLQWNAKPKVGSLDNATYKPGGGDKKIETVKLDFKDKAKPKVGSKDNAKHVPGGGTVKSSSTPPKTPQDPPNDIETQKIDIKAESKIGSLDNVKHKPGGGDKKIFNDRDYLRQTGSNVESLNGSGTQIKSPSVAERPSFIEMKSSPPEPNPPPSTPTRSRPNSAMSPVTPRALRTSLQAKSPESPTMKKVTISEEMEKSTNGDRSSTPSSARKSPIAEGPGTPRRPKTPSRSARSSRPPSSLDIRAADKSPNSSRKSSPKAVHLPKLTSSPLAENSNQALAKEESKIKLPKLMETSTLSSRLELAQ